jgi:hypothetical protein
MYHAIGLSAVGQTHVWPLEVDGRIRFRSHNFQANGYFRLLSPAFESYAQRDAGIDITSINVLLCLTSNDLDDALKSLDDIEHYLETRPAMWREYLGMYQKGREPPIPVAPLLLKSRAKKIVALLRRMVHKAKAENKIVVYGNGVTYRYLCGIKLPPGVKEYS